MASGPAAILLSISMGGLGVYEHMDFVHFETSFTVSSARIEHNSFLKTARELDASLNSAVDHDTGRALLSFLTVFTCPFSLADHLRNCFLVAWHSVRLPRA